MSEFMRSVNGGSARQAGNRPREIQANICIQIRDFDLSAPGGAAVIGIARSPAFLEGQEVSIRLQNENESLATFRKDKDGKANEKFFRTRPTIEKLHDGYRVGRNDVPAMQPGGFLMMYGCLRDGRAPEGSPEQWKAQYPENFGNDMNRDVFAGVGRVTVRDAREEGGRSYKASGKIELLSPADARLVSSLEELKGFYDDWMVGDRGGVQNDAMAALRICDKATNTVKSCFVFTPRVPVEVPDVQNGGMREIKIPGNSEAARSQLKQSDGLQKIIYLALAKDFSGLESSDKKVSDTARFAKMLAGELESGKLTLEAIPGMVIPLVGDSLEEAMDPASKLGRVAQRSWYKKDPSASAGAKDNMANGFVRMTVGIMTSEVVGAPQSVIATRFAADANAYAYGINNVRTANVSPAFGKQRDQQAEQQSEQAAAAGGHDAHPGNFHGDEPVGVERERSNDAPEMAPGM